MRSSRSAISRVTTGWVILQHLRCPRYGAPHHDGAERLETAKSDPIVNSIKTLMHCEVLLYYSIK